MTHNKTAAAYIRVSTDDQLELSPLSQLAEIQSYCKREQIDLPTKYIFIEEDGKSGRASQNREAFQTMIATAKTLPKPFDMILLWEFSRFARNQDEATFYKSLLRKKLGIEVVSVKEPIPQGMYGRLIEMIIEWQDEFYSVNLSAEVTRSMKLKALQGLYNSKMPLGYAKENTSLPVIVPQEAKIVQSIFQMYLSGYSKSHIAAFLNEQGYLTKNQHSFDAGAVGYILENPFYIGKVRWNRRQSSDSSRYKDSSEWIIADSHHPPIIDRETWDLVQERLGQTKTIRPANRPKEEKHWLSGILSCCICGRPLTIKRGFKGNHYCDGFQCPGYSLGHHPTSQYISVKKASNLLLTTLMEFTLSSPPDFPDLLQYKLKLLHPLLLSPASYTEKNIALGECFEKILYQKTSGTLEFICNPTLLESANPH